MVGLVKWVVRFGFQEEVGFVGLNEIAFFFGFAVVFHGLKDQGEVRNQKREYVFFLCLLCFFCFVSY